MTFIIITPEQNQIFEKLLQVADGAFATTINVASNDWEDCQE